MDDVPTLRKRLLERCDAKYAEARFRGAGGKQAAHAVLRARAIIESAELPEETREYLATLKAAVLAEKERIRGSGEDDEDGWYLGGLQTVVRAIEDAEAGDL
jgi:hypothetical protein